MRKSKFETYDKIYLALHSRLNRKGVITTDEAWKITHENYHTLSTVFRGIMGIMVAKGKAKKIRNGKWEILKDASLRRLKN